MYLKITLKPPPPRKIVECTPLSGNQFDLLISAKKIDPSNENSSQKKETTLVIGKTISQLYSTRSNLFSFQYKALVCSDFPCFCVISFPLHFSIQITSPILLLHTCWWCIVVVTFPSVILSIYRSHPALVLVALREYILSNTLRHLSLLSRNMYFLPKPFPKIQHYCSIKPSPNLL